MQNEGGFAGHPKKRIRVFWGPRSRPYKNNQRSLASRPRFGVRLVHIRSPCPRNPGLAGVRRIMCKSGKPDLRWGEIRVLHQRAIIKLSSKADRVVLDPLYRALSTKPFVYVVATSMFAAGTAGMKAFRTA